MGVYLLNLRQGIKTSLSILKFKIVPVLRVLGNSAGHTVG